MQFIVTQRYTALPSGGGEKPILPDQLHTSGINCKMLTKTFRISLLLLAKPFLGSPFPLWFQRRWARGFTTLKSVAKGTSFKSMEMNTVPARLVTNQEPSDKAVLYLHGGAYVMGSPTTHQGLVSHLADKSKAAVYALDYRLAPENIFPAALDDVISAYQWLLNNGYSPENITIAGDSAGGGLAVAAISKMQKIDLPLPRKALLMSPFVDQTLSGNSITQKKKADPFIRADWLEACGKLYRAGAPEDDPYCSPLFADLSGFPETMIQVGSDEILLDDAIRLHSKLKASGSVVTLKIYEDMWHVFQLLAGLHPIATEAVQDCADFIQGGSGDK